MRFCCQVTVKCTFYSVLKKCTLQDLDEDEELEDDEEQDAEDEVEGEDEDGAGEEEE